jgi:hypothetical protein
MSNFEGTILYTCLVYLILYIHYVKDLDDSKTKWQDYLVLYTAPISVPIVIIWTIFTVIIED